MQETSPCLYDTPTANHIPPTLSYPLHCILRCGQCKKLAPVWDQLGARYKRQKQHIIIAAMDTATNDVPDDTGSLSS